MKYVTPSVRETAFNCPHCGVLTTQYWYSIRADSVESSDRLPFVPTRATADQHLYEHVPRQDMRDQLKKSAEQMMEGLPIFHSGKDGNFSFQSVSNVNLSRCYNCKEVGIWVSDKIVYPQRHKDAPEPNPDLPENIKRDLVEAASILSLSPRGAAALARLAIQKLCKHLGETGKDINADIGALVAKGLDARVQKALDAVRVIGNHAVHPGKIDLTDDRDTAESLLKLLNLIAEKMISEPKHVDQVYSMLPQTILKQIETRDKDAQGQ